MSGPSNSDNSNFGGGGGNTSFDCTKVSIKTNIISPDPTILATISVGIDLDIKLQTPTGPLIAVSKKGGSVLRAVFTQDPASLIECINKGYLYKATILVINGGDVQIIITNT
jgi:hypothetical protein